MLCSRCAIDGDAKPREEAQEEETDKKGKKGRERGGGREGTNRKGDAPNQQAGTQ